MSAALEVRPRSRAVALEWLPVAAGLLFLYLPVGYDLSRTLWRQEEYAHGPVILAVIAWLVWRKRGALQAASAAAPVAGLGLLVLGLLAYVLGRSQDISFLEVGSLAPVSAGVVLGLRGWPALRALWFPILFVAFLAPLPGAFVDGVTASLKQSVSEVAERILYAAGYPVARTGVVLTVGQYQLLVADACSGINSMFSLLALGLLYLHFARRSGILHNGILVAALAPIAFAANIARTLLLVLVTYHFGDAAGQSFLHGAAGVVLIVAALAGILCLDAVLARLMPRATPA